MLLFNVTHVPLHHPKEHMSLRWPRATPRRAETNRPMVVPPWPPFSWVAVEALPFSLLGDSLSLPLSPLPLSFLTRTHLFGSSTLILLWVGPGRTPPPPGLKRSLDGGGAAGRGGGGGVAFLRHHPEIPDPPLPLTGALRDSRPFPQRCGSQAESGSGTPRPRHRPAPHRVCRFLWSKMGGGFECHIRREFILKYITFYSEYMGGFEGSFYVYETIPDSIIPLIFLKAYIECVMASNCFKWYIKKKIILNYMISHSEH